MNRKSAKRKSIYQMTREQLEADKCPDCVEDPLVNKLLSRHRGHMEQYVDPVPPLDGMLLAELRRHGYPVSACSTVEKWYRYRKGLKSLLKRARVDPAVAAAKSEIERELRLTMAVLAGYYYACGEELRDKMYREYGRMIGDIYAETKECAARFEAYVAPCYQRANTTECVTARIESLLRGARNPATVLALLKK